MIILNKLLRGVHDFLYLLDMFKQSNGVIQLIWFNLFFSCLLHRMIDLLDSSICVSLYECDPLCFSRRNRCLSAKKSKTNGNLRRIGHCPRMSVHFLCNAVSSVILCLRDLHWNWYRNDPWTFSRHDWPILQKEKGNCGNWSHDHLLSWHFLHASLHHFLH